MNQFMLVKNVDCNCEAKINTHPYNGLLFLTIRTERKLGEKTLYTNPVPRKLGD